MSDILAIHTRKLHNDDLIPLQELFYETFFINGSTESISIAFVQDGKIKTIRDKLSPSAFFEKYDLGDCVNEDGGLYLLSKIGDYDCLVQENNAAIVHTSNISPEVVIESMNNESNTFIDRPDVKMMSFTLSTKRIITSFSNVKNEMCCTRLPDTGCVMSLKDVTDRALIFGEQAKLRPMVNYVISGITMHGYNNRTLLTSKLFG